MRNTAISGFDLHPTQDLKVEVRALYPESPTKNTFTVRMMEDGHHISIFFSDGEALTKFSEDLQQQVLDARMAQEGVPA
mgnify:FL=1